MNGCTLYEGPERTDELKAAVVGITISAPKPPTLDQIKAWFAAEFSLLREGPVPLPIFDQRMAQCVGCDQRREVTESDPGWCAACGCGARERARLAVKLHMPKTCCPKGNWGCSDGEGRKHLKRIGGVTKQVRAQVRQAAGSLWKLTLDYMKGK